MIKQQDAETVRSIRRTTKAGRNALMLSAGALALICAQPALAQPAANALPTGYSDVSGVGLVAESGPDMTIHQNAPRALVTWESFSIGSGASVTFVQPDSSSVIVNRVQAGGGLSEIYGRMDANGVVAILNPNGVHFGGGAQVNVGGLIASTGDLADQAAYLAGDALSFSGAASGTVNIHDGASIMASGLAAFVAPHVVNSGVINATAGRVVLASGDTFTLDLAGDGLLALGVSSQAPIVENHGDIFARGGTIRLSAAAASGVVGSIINDGGLNVRSVGVGPDGVVVLEGSNTTVDLRGQTYDADFRIANGLGLGGSLTVEGDGARILGTMNVRTNEAVALNDLAFELDGFRAIDATTGAVAGLELTLNDVSITATANQGSTQAIMLAAGDVSQVTLNLNRAHFSDMDYGVYVERSNIVNSTGSTFENVVRAFIVPPAQSRLTLIDNSFTGVAVNIAAGARLGALVMSGNQYVGGSGENAAVRVSSGAASYLMADDISVNGGALFVASNTTVSGAVNDALAGDTIFVGAGSYAEAVAIDKSLTIQGAGIDDTTLTGGISLHGFIDGLTLADFTVRGAASDNTVIRGVSSTVEGLRLDGVRVDGENVADRFGVIGGRFSGDITITDSEFRNIDNWAVFDTRSGSGAPGHGTDVSSFTFTGNLIDNVNGGVTVRQNDGGTGSILISNNTVSNIGDSPRTSGGIFKIFNAGTVDFSGNTISGVGQNASPTGDGLFYGAALLMRGVDTLNVTGNTFENVHMAVATERNGYAAPNQTTFTGNSFTNVGYGLFMPSDALSGGAVTFGAGNNFVTGADTVQHVVWRGAAGLDLTGVRFDGLTGAQMSGAQRLALEDRITHGVDIAGAGLARVVAGQIYVTENAGDGAINRAVQLSASGDTINIAPGDYLEGFSAGGRNFGLFVDHDNLTLRGVDANGVAITDAAEVGAWITSLNRSSFGAHHYVTGSGVTIQGLGFGTVAAGGGKTVEVTGDAFSLLNSVIDNSGSTAATNLYISGFTNENDPAPHWTPVESFTVEGNIFTSGADSNKIVVVGAGVGLADPASRRVISGNIFNGNGQAIESGVHVQGLIPGQNWQAREAGAVTIEGNTFNDVAMAVRSNGSLTQSLDWNGIFAGNIFSGGAALTYVGDTDQARASALALGTGLIDDIFISSGIQASINQAADGDTVRVLAGTYDGFGTAFGGAEGVRILGATGAVIDGSGVAGRIVDLRADGTTLSGFEIIGDGMGVGVSISGRGVEVSGNTITGTLTGVQTTTQYAAGGATISGNTISAAHGVSLQNTGNVVSGNTVTASVEGVGLAQGANSFSGNRFDIAAGADALNLYGSASAGDLIVSNNTVSIQGGRLQGAVDLAGEGGGVDAGAATYAETVTIRHGLTLTGAGEGATVINGGVVIAGHAPAGSFIDGLSLSDLTINAGTGQLGLIAYSAVDGVYNTRNLSLTDVTINGAAQHAVGLFDVDGVDFTNVTINAVAGFNGIEAVGLNDFNMTGGAISGAGVGVNVFDVGGYEANGALAFARVSFAGNRTHLDVANADVTAILAGNDFDRTVYATGGSAIHGDLAHAVNVAVDGDQLNLSANIFALTSALIINDSIALVGAGQGQTIIDASATSTYGIRVHADDVSLSGFTLSGGNGYGIKVEAAGSPAPHQRRNNFQISDVTIENTWRTGLDLNAVYGAEIDGVTVTGVGSGNGISITDSAYVTVSNSATSGNAWAGLGLFQRNDVGRGDSDQQLANIVIEGSNSFAEADGVYLQAYASALHDVGALTIEGYDFVSQNDNTDGGVSTYTFFDRTLQNAFDRGVNLVNASDTVVGGWSGSDHDGNLYVGFGELTGGGQAALSIQTAFDASDDGDVINIASGDYGQTSTLNAVRLVRFDDVTTESMTFGAGAAGSGVGGRLTAGDIVLANVILTDSTTLIGDTVSVAGAEGSSVNGQSLIIQSAAASLGSAGADVALRNLMVLGNATLTGSEYAAFGVAVNGAATLARNVSITASGPVVLGSVDGAHALSIRAGGPATLGRVGAATALASLSVSGSTISTAGATTRVGQTYAGATTLNGAYASGGDFAVAGATTLGGATTIASGGDASLGPVSGAFGLTVSAKDAVTLGAVDTASLSATGAAIATSGATTTGGQSYAGATTLNGAYASGGGFAVDGAATLTGAVTVSTSGGSARFGAVNGSSAGGQAFTLNTRGGDASLGAMGARVRLGAVSVTAGRTVLNGATYAGDSLYFGGGAGATVRLTQVTTTFNTVQSATTGGAITILPHLIGTVNGEQGVVFLAGSGASAGDGDVTLRNAGTDAVRLGAMTATGGDFSAETVKLAGDFTSQLSGDQLFSANTLDTLGNVDVTAAGAESGPIIAGGSVNINAGRSGAGSIQAGGSVNATYGAGTERVIVASGPVTVNAGGPVGGSITSGGAVNVTSGGAITSTINADGAIVLTSTQPVQVLVNGGVVTVNAPGGTINGVFSQISTDPRGTFVINGETVVGEGVVNARQILVDGFIVPAGGVVGATGQISLPAGLAIALIAPAGEGEGQRPAVIVNNVDRLGELLRLGYTAIVIQIDESGLVFEEELVVAQTEIHQAASGAQ